MHYVYKITNTVNQKIYIGKRKSSVPYEDSYMGSGSQIKAAIQKYGKANFIKEILGVFKTDDEASLFESLLVTRELIESGSSYNMHEGGHGGFYHINSLPVEQRPNVLGFRRKLANGEIRPGGDTSMFFTEDSYRRIREGSKKGNEALKNLSDEAKKSKAKKISDKSIGSKNHQYGSVWCVEESATDLSNRKKFKDIPDGYISTTEWRNKRKNKTASSYGRHWYNDGSSNFYLYPTDERIDSLYRGRLKNSLKASKSS